MSAVERWWGRGKGLICWVIFWKVVAPLFRGFLSPLACPDLIRRESTALRNVLGEGGRLFPRRGPWVLEGTREVRQGNALNGGGRDPPSTSLGGGGDDNDRARASAPPGLSSAGGGREEGVEVRGEEEGWHRSAAVSVQ